MKRALPYLAVVAVVGCGGATTAFTRTGPTLPPEPEKCEFSVVTAAPDAPTTELGTIKINYMKQTDWIYDQSAFKRKVRADVCRSGGDVVVAHVNDNGLYMSATVLTTKAQVAKPSPEEEVSEPEAIAEADEPVPTPPAATPAAPAKGAQPSTKPRKSGPAKDAQAAAVPGMSGPGTGTEAPAAPANKDRVAKDDDAAKPETGKKRGKKGPSAKKDDDVRGKDGKVDIDKLL